MSWFKKSPGDGSAAETPRAVDAGVPEIEPLTDDEVEWVRTTIAGLDEQGVRRNDIDDLGRHYDELLTGWLRLRESDRPDPNAVITQIGLAFGQIIANHTGLEWGVASVEGGVEIALHRSPPAPPMLLYPADIVSQRWTAHQTGVLPALTRATIQAVRDVPPTG